jgi:hypothetical protein
MPTPTDLVTDLPADFEVFGQAVDTSMADLKGGTTGQILSKASNTNMDFTWITNDVGDITAVNVTAPITGGGTSGAVTIGVDAATTSAAGVVQLSDSTSTTSSVLASTPTATKSAYDLANTANTTANAAIAKTTVTTAGDIIYRNATVPTRLGIGTANQVLAVNSGATAPEWKTPTSGLNFISRTTFSNQASQIFDNVFSSSYYSYIVNIEYIYGAVTTDELQLQMRYGTTTQAANYLGATRGLDSSGNLTSVLTGGTSFRIWERISGSSLPSTVTLTFNKVGNASENAQWHGTGLYGNTPYSYFTAGEVNAAQTYTGFLLKSSSSNVTGAVSIYGLGKA